jgi:hypothetical protein
MMCMAIGRGSQCIVSGALGVVHIWALSLRGIYIYMNTYEYAYVSLSIYEQKLIHYF